MVLLWLEGKFNLIKKLPLIADIVYKNFGLSVLLRSCRTIFLRASCLSIFCHDLCYPLLCIFSRNTAGPQVSEIMSTIIAYIYYDESSAVGQIRTVVSIVHCGCTDPGSIPGFDRLFIFLHTSTHSIVMKY